MPSRRSLRTSRSQSTMPRRRQNPVGTNRARPSCTLRWPTAPAPGPATCHQRSSGRGRSEPANGYQTHWPPSPPENASSSVAAPTYGSTNSPNLDGATRSEPRTLWANDGFPLLPTLQGCQRRPAMPLSRRSGAGPPPFPGPEGGALAMYRLDRGIGTGLPPLRCAPGLPSTSPPDGSNGSGRVSLLVQGPLRWSGLGV